MTFTGLDANLKTSRYRSSTPFLGRRQFGSAEPRALPSRKPGTSGFAGTNTAMARWATPLTHGKPAIQRTLRRRIFRLPV